MPKPQLDRKQVANRLKPLCNNPDQWEAFCAFLDLEIALNQAALEQADNSIVMHRAQGAISTLRKFKHLRDEANS